jgi:hypothetical protein
MIGRALSSEFLKIKGKGLWFLICIGPIGMLAMQALNFGLRYDYLTDRYADRLWEVLLENLMMFVPIALYMGVTLVSSLIANIEHHTNAWKLLLALPVSRSAVFLSKFLLSLILMLCSCILLAIGTIVLGISLRFGTDFPVGSIMRMSFLPFLAAIPALALFHWLCMTMKNQAIPITLGIVTAIISVFSFSLWEWFPLNWPLYGYQGEQPWQFSAAGIGSGLLILLMTLVHFSRKDVD